MGYHLTVTQREMNPQTPELIALCRLGEDGEDQLAGWAMVLPETGKVVVYVQSRTSVGTAMLVTFASLDSAALILSYADLYPATDAPSAARRTTLSVAAMETLR